MKNIKAAIRMLLFVAGTCVIVPYLLVHKVLTRDIPPTWIWHHWACLVFGIKVRFSGVKARSIMPTVYLSNHLSYLDIVALGAHFKGKFVAKSEVAKWPVFGFLAKIQYTIFIHRTREALEQSTADITDALRAGYDIVLFGEGTSTDGRTVLPFKASLLEMLFGDVVAQVQPVAVVLENATTQEERDLYTWWRPEDTLAPHLWNFARGDGADLAIHYLPVLDPKNFVDRKSLALAAHDAVQRVVEGNNDKQIMDFALIAR